MSILACQSVAVALPSFVNNNGLIENCRDGGIVQRFSLEPGRGNTRLIPETPAKVGRLDAHLDYLRFTATVGSLAALQELCRFLFWENYQLSIGDGWSAGKGAVRFPNGLTADFGARGGWRFHAETSDGVPVDLTDGLPTDDSVPVDVMVDLPGEYWRAQGTIGAWRMLLGLKHAFGVRASRIDLAIDDFGFDRIPVDEMVAATKSGNGMFFCKYQLIENYDSRRRRECKTHYFGSRESGKMVRIYDHVFEDGVTKAHRMETEFKRGYATKIFDELASIERECDGDYEMEDCFQRAISSYVTGSIDFRDKSVRKDKSKASAKDCPRLKFWQAFINEIGDCVRVKLDPVIKTVEKSVKWLKRSVAPTLSAFYQSLSSVDRIGFISNLVEIGSERGGALHKLIKKIGANEPDRMRIALCQ